MSPETLHQILLASQPVSTEAMAAGGFPKPILDAADKLGLNWLTLVSLFLKYGPLLLQILQELADHKDKP